MCQDRVDSAATLALSIAAPLMLSAVAHSEEGLTRTVFGMELGQPLALPPCKSTSEYNITCARLLYGAYGRKDDQLYVVWFQEDHVPAPFAVPSGFYVRVIHNRIESASITTFAYNQAEAFQALKIKYGEPISSEIVHKQNESGAPIDAISAKWRFSDLSIVFDGAYDLRHGSILIETAVAAEFDRDKEAKSPSGGPRF